VASFEATAQSIRLVELGAIWRLSYIFGIRCAGIFRNSRSNRTRVN